jgi:hypothetical protein
MEEESDKKKRPFEDELIDVSREDDRWKMPIRKMLWDIYKKSVKRIF